MIVMPLSLFFSALAACAVGVLLWAPFTFEVRYTRAAEEHTLAVSWKVFGVRISLMPFVRMMARATLSQMKNVLPEPKTAELRSGKKELWGRGQQMGRAAVLLVQEIVSLHLDLKVGLADPFLTAAACGSAWAALGLLLAGLQARVRLLSAPRIAVTPQHGQPGIAVNLACIFRFRLGQIIRDVIRSLAGAVAQHMQMKEW